jgi:hypothetical protein
VGIRGSDQSLPMDGDMRGMCKFVPVDHFSTGRSSSHVGHGIDFVAHGFHVPSYGFGDALSLQKLEFLVYSCGLIRPLLILLHNGS